MLIEPWDDTSVRVTFRWRGEAARTRAWWGVDVELTRRPGSDRWSGSAVLPTDLVTIYGFVHDGAEALPETPAVTGPVHLDPANPRRVLFPGDPADPDDADHWASLLELPDAPPDHWSAARPGVPPGRLTNTTVGGRTVTIHQPAGTSLDGAPALIVFDGYLAQTMLRIPTVLDNLLAAGRIPPMAALFVPSPVAVRNDELTPRPPIERYVTGELLPWAAAELGVRGPHLVAGSSRGGLAATYLGLRRPDLFAGVISQSGSFWWPAPDEGEPGRLLRDLPGRNGVRFHLDVGNRETMPGPGGAPDQLTVNRAMRDALRAQGHPVSYAEYTGGHDYVNWRRTFADGLLAVTRNHPG